MAKLRPEGNYNEDNILKVLETTGEMDTKEISEYTGLTYWQTRYALDSLVKKELIYASRTKGKAIRFMSKGSTALPSLATGEGEYINTAGIAKYIDAGNLFVKHEELNPAINRAFACIYAQPILAQSKSMIDNDELKQTQFELKKAIKRLEKALTVAKEMDDRLFSDNPERYMNWYNDAQYDPKIAMSLRKKFFDTNIHYEEPSKELNINEDTTSGKRSLTQEQYKKMLYKDESNKAELLSLYEIID